MECQEPIGPSVKPGSDLPRYRTINYKCSTETHVTDALGHGTKYFLDTSYGRNAENQLVRVVKPGTGPLSFRTINYRYDALGRRVERQMKRGGTTAFTYDGQDVILDQKGDGSTTTYVNGPGIDNKIKQTNSVTGTHYYLQDHLGSTTALTDASGNITAQMTYDGYGNSSSNTLTRYGYTGRELDAVTGLIYYRARWYDPLLGRFISEDPIGFAGGINLNLYVENDPVNGSDPLGLYEPQSYENPRDIRPFIPVIYYEQGGWYYHLFGDGGIFRRQTFEEFISATERAKQPCKPIGERFIQNFEETNNALPGSFAPPGLGFISGGAAAETLGYPSLLQRQSSWFGPMQGMSSGQLLGGAAISGAANAFAVAYSYEGGVAIGSIISAETCPCGY